MIQRKQSLYLFLASLICLSFIIGNPVYYKLSGTIHSGEPQQEATVEISLKQSVLYTTNTTVEQLTQDNIYLLMTLIVIAALSFFNIFLFKKRELQLRFSSYLIIFDLLLIFLMFYQVKQWGNQFDSDTLIYSFKWVGASLMILPLLHFLSLRGIIHDIKLLKAVDRLR
jgi:hypothetical protein